MALGMRTVIVQDSRNGDSVYDTEVNVVVEGGNPGNKWAWGFAPVPCDADPDFILYFVREDNTAQFVGSVQCLREVLSRIPAVPTGN